MGSYTSKFLSLKHKEWFGAVCDKNAKLEDIKKLVESGHIDIDIKDDLLEWSALHYASFFGCGEISDYLLSKGADVDSRDIKGSTPLHIACTTGRVDIIEKLVRANASFDLKNYNGVTPKDLCPPSVNMEAMKPNKWRQLKKHKNKAKKILTKSMKMVLVTMIVQFLLIYLFEALAGHFKSMATVIYMMTYKMVPYSILRKLHYLHVMIEPLKDALEKLFSKNLTLIKFLNICVLSLRSVWTPKGVSSRLLELLRNLKDMEALLPRELLHIIGDINTAFVGDKNSSDMIVILLVIVVTVLCSMFLLGGYIFKLVYSVLRAWEVVDCSEIIKWISVDMESDKFSMVMPDLFHFQAGVFVSLLGVISVILAMYLMKVYSRLCEALKTRKCSMGNVKHNQKKWAIDRKLSSEIKKNLGPKRNHFVDPLLLKKRICRNLSS